VAADICAADEVEVFGEKEAENLFTSPLFNGFLNSWSGYLALVVCLCEEFSDLLRGEEGILSR